MPRMGRLIDRAALLLVCQGTLGACSVHTYLTPTVGTSVRPDCALYGHLSYDGNRDYLPAVLVEHAESPADAVLRYTHEERYGLKEVPAMVQFVNPLNLVGFPTGSTSLAISGRLDVMRGGAVVRSFAAVAAMRGNRSMFSEGETFTAMRRRGLLLVRDNISAQVCADLATTQAIVNAAAVAH